MKPDFSFLRLGDWFIKYSFVIVSIFMVMLVTNTFRPNELIATFAFSILGFSFTFSFNYYMERDADEKVGKNRVKGIGKAIVIPIFILMTAGMIAIPIVYSNLFALGISIFYILMSIAYSVKPLYLKIRGILSVVSQGVFLDVPHFLFFIALTKESITMLILYLSVWLFLVTAKGAIIHQILDYENDLELSMKTLAVVYGKEKTIKISFGFVIGIFVFGLAGLFLFDYPYNVLLAMMVIFSNPKYKTRRMGIRQ